MKIKDKVYGAVVIKEPLLVDLINSKPLQRAKGVNQFTHYPRHNYWYPTFSRYEHCVGVMILLKKLNAGLDEQVAGLLHDVSHTAFSHAADIIFGDYTKQNFHDSIFEEYIKQSEIPEIVKRHDFHLEKVFDESRYTLLENEIPDLCADRVDYSLREMAYWAVPDKVDYLVGELTAFSGKIVFKSKEAADLFAKTFLRLYQEHWNSREKFVKDYVFSMVVKKAYEEKIISYDNLMQTDDFVLAKLETSENQSIKEGLAFLRNPEYVLTTENPQYVAKNKFRYVDPEFIENGKLVRLSEVDADFKQSLASERVKSEQGHGFNLPFSL